MADGGGMTKSLAIKPYCAETVLLHSAFVLAEKEALVPLAIIDKKCSKYVVGIISDTVVEILGSSSDHQLSHHLNSWIFNELCRSNTQSFDEEADKFSEFPPLPRFSCAFYVELIKELRWDHLMTETLYSAFPKIIEEVMNGLISTVTSPDTTDDADSSLLFLFVTTLLQAHAQRCDPRQGVASSYHTTAASLLKGISCVRKKTIDPVIHINVIRGVIDLVVCSAVQEAVKCQAPCMADNLLKARLSLQIENSIYQEDNTDVGTHIYEVQESVDSQSCAHEENKAQSDGSKGSITCSKEVHVIAVVDFLYSVIVQDWAKTSHWSMKYNITNSGTSDPHSAVLTAGQVDVLSWHPLHKCFVALSGALCFLIPNCSDSKQQLQMKELCDGLQLYIETFGLQSEKDWLRAMNDEALVTAGTAGILEEFQAPSEPMEMFLFKPDTPEELFKYSLGRVCGRLTGCEECFDWLLTAEQFHGHDEWLECFKVHGPQLSNQKQVMKMIDILCLQWQVLSSGGSTDDKLFAAVRSVALEVHSKLEWSEQEEILLYSQRKSCNHVQDMRVDSIFFHPFCPEEDRVSFGQDLVETFNKLVMSSESNTFDTGMQAGILKAALVMPYVLLSRTVEEAMKHAANVSSIYKMLQKLSCLCRCRMFDSGPSLLSTVLRSAAVCVSSKQQENNLHNLLVLLLQPTDADGTGILACKEVLEVVVLPFLFRHDDDDSISTAFAVQLLNVTMATIDVSRQGDAQLMKEHCLPILLCLCELLDSCCQLWADMAPGSSLMDMEELKMLVLGTLGRTVDIFSELLQRVPHVSRGVAWLYRRLAGYNWTIPLHLAPLFQQSNVVPALLVPPCLVAVCSLPAENWIPHPSLCYGQEAVFTALFEACCVSDVMCQTFIVQAERLGPVMEGSLVTTLVRSLAQVLPHCVWQEHQRVMSVCRQLINKRVIQILCREANYGDDQSVTSQLSCLLLKVLDFLSRADCHSWVNQHVWTHVTKHYVASLKGFCDEKTDISLLVTLFAHVCHVMSVVSSHVTDQLFVLALDLVARMSIGGEVSNAHVLARLKECTSSLPNGLHKAALMQKLLLPSELEWRTV